MNILLSYSYRPYATGVYFERALKKYHSVVYCGPATHGRAGYSADQDILTLIAETEFAPDLFFALDYGADFFPRHIEALTCPTIIYLIDVHLGLKPRMEYSQLFDYVFVAQKDYVGLFRDIGLEQVYWLPLACDPEVHGMKERRKIFDIGFVGQIHSSHRAQRLQLLASRYKLNDYQRRYSKEEISEIYSSSRIVFNTSINGDLNMRVFEAMASGALLVTDRIDNGQKDLFEPGVHLVEYDNDGELLEKVEYYLSHDTEREQIARAGHELVLSKHTYAHRCRQILETVFSKGQPVLKAPAREWNTSERLKIYTNIYYYKRAVEPLLGLLETSKSEQKNVNWRILYKTILAFVRKIYRVFR